MLLVMQVTKRRLLIIDIVIIFAQIYGLIMEPHALIEAVLMLEQQDVQAMVIVLIQVLGN